MESDHPLRKWRDENEVTLSALADRVHVKASHLSMLERGKRGASPGLVRRLREATGLPSREIAPKLVEAVTDELQTEAAE